MKIENDNLIKLVIRLRSITGKNVPNKKKNTLHNYLLVNILYFTQIIKMSTNLLGKNKSKSLV